MLPPGIFGIFFLWKPFAAEFNSALQIERNVAQILLDSAHHLACKHISRKSQEDLDFGDPTTRLRNFTDLNVECTHADFNVQVFKVVVQVTEPN